MPMSDRALAARVLAEAKVDSRTVICILTHEPKFDVPVLELALKSSRGVPRSDG
jgi:xanthine dehydrogenase accessory factor